MDARYGRGYEAAGRRSPRGPTPRGDERCVSVPSERAIPGVVVGRPGTEKGSPLMASIDSLKTRRELTVGDKTYAYYSLRAAEEAGLSGVSRLPISMKV